MFKYFRFLPIAAMAFVAIVMVSCGTFSPSGNGDKLFQLGEYTKAAELYKKSYTKEKNKYLKGEISFQMGECYRLTNKPSKAATAYSRAMRTTYKNPLMELYVAQSLLKMGKVDDAYKLFVSYNEKHPLDALGRSGLKSCDLIMAKAKPSRFEVEKFKEINSKYSDYGAAYGSSDIEIIYFSSMRFAGKRKGLNKITGQGPSKIYALRKDSKGKWLKPEVIEEFGESTFDEGGISISAEGKELFFTRCRFDKTKVIGAEIFTSKRTAGIWGEPELLPLAGDSLVSAHPAISPDNLVLYFVSDLPGGQGGKDIWKVEREKPDGEWGKPLNLGYPVNTKGDEMFPSVSPTGTLYFSSDGHPGYGGLDIFRLGTDDKDSLAVFNMGIPINSSADDFGIVFKPDANEGLFTSSRENLKGIDNIFNFSWRDVVISMKGKVYDEKGKNPVPNAYLRLVGADGTDKKIDISNDGSFKSVLLPKTDYVFLVAAPGYFNQRKRFTTPPADDDKEFVFDIALSLKVNPISMEPIFYGSSSWQPDNEALNRLERLAQLLIDNPTVRIEIASHTDAAGNSTDLVILSQKRAQAIIDFLTEKGVEPQRLIANSFAGTKPITITNSMVLKRKFLKAGDVLNSEKLNSLRTADRNNATRLNHRTEFRILE